MAGEKNREKLILDSAIVLFTTKGYEATRIEDVAKKAGISKGLTYFYFKNKEDLFMALTKKAFDQLKEEFRESFTTKGRSGLEMVMDLVKRILEFSEKQPVYYQSIIHFLDLMKKYTDPNALSEIDPKISDSDHFQKLLEIHQDPIKTGIQMISQGIKDGSIRPELQPEVTFYTIWSMIIGFEKIAGLIAYDRKEAKISQMAWKAGYQKLILDLLKGTIQSGKQQAFQTSLF